jgi:hypothetical protein
LVLDSNNAESKDNVDEQTAALANATGFSIGASNNVLSTPLATTAVICCVLGHTL